MIALTQRELVVSALLVNGVSLKRVATILDMTYHAADRCRKSAKRKFGVSTVTDLAKALDKPLIWGVCRPGSERVSAA
jgi:DNA-binding CsgD family transcriptional regulator